MLRSVFQDRQDQPNLTAISTLSLALIAVSFAPIFIRFSETELGANATVFNRFAIFVLCFGSIHWGRRRIDSADSSAESTDTPESLTVRQGLLLVGVGLSSVISLVLWAVSLEYTTVAKCMLLNNLTPLFTSLGSWLLLGKRFDKRFLIGMAIALVGAIALTLEDLTGVEGFLLGDLYALLSAVFLGAYFLLVEQLRTQFSATTILLWRCVIGSAVLFPITLFTEGQIFPETKVAILAVLGLGLISEGLGQRLLADCLDKFSSSFVALFLLLEPIVSALLAWLIFTEALSPITWVGFAVVLSGIYTAQSSEASTQAIATEQVTVKV
ncbi:MAG: DMT family transporter [Phormidesmis sp.]